MADETTDSGSPQRVAFDMAQRLWAWEQQGKSADPSWRKGFLDLYAECFDATRGRRST